MVAVNVSLRGLSTSVVIAVAAWVSGVNGFVTVRPLNSAEIAEAIAAAQAGPLPSYDLKSRHGEAVTGTTVGRVYTPWLRVACFAKGRIDAGHQLTPNEIPVELMAPIVVVGFFAVHPMTVDTASVLSIEAIPHSADDHVSGQRPLWLKTEGIDPACDVETNRRISAVAAFPVSVLQADTDVILRSGNRFQFFAIRGTISAQDLAVWR